MKLPPLPPDAQAIGEETEHHAIHANFHWDQHHRLRVAAVYMNALAWEEVLQALKNGGLAPLALTLEKYQKSSDFSRPLEATIEQEHVPTTVPWL